MVDAVEISGRKKKKSEVSVSIPRLAGKAMKKHRMDHEREHLFMMSWMNRKPFLVENDVS